jgi:hypothetical protein
MAVNTTTGRVVLVANASGIGKIRTSDDAGTSWTSRADITFGIGPIDNLAIVRDSSVANRWILVANRTSGASNTEVWESTDDAQTFTRIHQNVVHALYRPASLGRLFVGVTLNPTASRNEVVFSLDGGASWTPAGVCVAGVVTSSDIYFGLRAGVPSFPAFT